MQVAGEEHLVADVEAGAVMVGPLPAQGLDGAVMLRLREQMGVLIPPLLPHKLYRVRFRPVPVLERLLFLGRQLQPPRRDAGLVAHALGLGLPQAGLQVQPVGALGF
ncbi:hypothetical protein D3C84_548400 [compost metagenome]